MDRGCNSIYTIQQMDITEIQDELLRLEYPNLLPDHDPDIERYYYLRSIGQARDAMAIYQNRLRVRYPEEAFRTWLLRAYRSHDPSFRGLLARGYRMLGARSLERVQGVLLVIADLAESFNEKDVYSTIKTVESILKFLPQERYEAVAGMDRYARYANALNLRVKSITKANELVRAYLTDTLSIVEEERRRRSDAQRRAEDMERQRLVQADWDSYYYQKKFGFRPGLLDLSTVAFSDEDLARIEIPNYSRVEDQILSYCFKYWNVVDDPAFERILFLYSRKYGKKNYDVYTAIRRGQKAKRRDDEILASIMSVLVTGYYYSIQGDLYLQRNWNALKRNLAQQDTLPVSSGSSGKTAVKKIEAKTQPRQIEDKRAGKTAAKQKSAAAAPEKSKKRVQPKPRIVPRTKTQSAFKIASKPVKPVRSVAVVARQAGKTPAASLVPAKSVKVPFNLKPAKQKKTTIVARAKPQPVRPLAAKPVARPAKPLAAKPVRPVKPMVAKAPVPSRAPKPTAPRPSLLRPATPKPVLMAKPSAPPVSSRATAPKPSAPKPALLKPATPKPIFMAKTPVSALPKPQKLAKPPKPPKPAKLPKPPKPPKPSKLPKPAKPPKPAKLTKPPKSAKPAASGYRPAPYVSASPSSSKNRPKPRAFSNRTLGKAKGSVSDRLKALSGHSYDVYEDRFLSKARTSIRKVLGTGKGLFFSLPEEAEDLVYNFLRDHYSDPYMDWENSTDRKNLLNLGFDLSSIHPVIDECYRTL